jgi:hypothetical protein
MMSERPSTVLATRQTQPLVTTNREVKRERTAQSAPRKPDCSNFHLCDLQSAANPQYCSEYAHEIYLNLL